MKNEARREQAGIVLQKLFPLKPFLDDEDLFEIVVNRPEEVIIEGADGWKTINIPPTLEKHHGEMVNIFVARDLDFSSVYRLKVTESKLKIFDRAVTGDFSKQPDYMSK